MLGVLAPDDIEQGLDKGPEYKETNHNNYNINNLKIDRLKNNRKKRM